MIVSDAYFHLPVLLPEVISALEIKQGKKYIDATLGGGGYAKKIAERGGIVLGIDQDADSLNYVRQEISDGNPRCGFNENLTFVQGNFADLEILATKNGFERVDGIIFDLGMSSFQIDKSQRGFSFERDEPLDMRMNIQSLVSAVDIINKYSVDKLYELFAKFAEELHSRAIASAIVRTRTVEGQILQTEQLVAIVDGVSKKVYPEGRSFLKNRKSVLARIFQAIRIEVNDELSNLKKGLKDSVNILNSKGRLAAISYHSLEDRIVKRIFHRYADLGKIEIISKSPILPGYKEREINTRSRSAKARIAQKI